MWPNKSPESTAVGAVSSAVTAHVASRRWLSFVRPLHVTTMKMRCECGEIISDQTDYLPYKAHFISIVASRAPGR
jgi:hypothetical protein